MTMKIDLKAVKNYVPGDIDLFIGSAGFEERGKSIVSIVNSNIKSCLLFKYSSPAKAVMREYRKLGKSLKIVDISQTHPLETTDVMLKRISESISKNRKPKVVIDISTFHREGLLILLRILYELRSSIGNFYVVYNPASYLGSWLSVGVSDVRPIIGFGGEIKPSRQTHAIILLGFEIERARSLIEKYEPQLISIGVSKLSQSENPEFYKRNMEFIDQLTSYYGDQVSKFNVSLDNPLSTKKDILRYAKKFQEYNTVLFPLNNKTSTLGVGLSALSNPAFQVAYAQAAVYNTKDFSAPSTDCHVFEIAL
jgi:hypothetical protein